MSLEKEIRMLTEAVVANTLAIRDSRGAAPIVEKTKAETPKAETPKAEKPKVNKVVLAEVKKKAGEVMENCGRDKLTWLLSCFGAKKISDLKAGAGVFPDFIRRAEELLQKAPEDVPTEETPPAEEELLDEAPEEPKKEKKQTKTLTLEEVKVALKKVIDHEGLGRNFVAAILEEFKVKKLGELKPAQYGQAIEMANAEIAKADKEDA